MVKVPPFGSTSPSSSRRPWSSRACEVTAMVRRSSLESTSKALSIAAVIVAASAPLPSPGAVTVATRLLAGSRVGSSSVGWMVSAMVAVVVCTAPPPAPPPPSLTATPKPSA
jgi:hypothetical protein